ncbi:unnamed protein product [Candidula unifasciata]|uniref:C2H2-type domain-containing protein n=1 Tax=Candidula unifasciata TaxID=100452 RepID=A0A8S3ZJZ1_9EUPU|nr:unnamed protein product [Candidula unifasciata]
MRMAATMEGFDDSDLTAAEIAMVTANERAGLVSQLACHFCGMQFDVKKTRSLRAHIEEVHVLGGAGYMCGVCCEEFTSRKAVETHMSTFHRAPKPLGCGTCGETFRIRNLLLKHIESHTQEEILANKVGYCYCGECFEFFENVSALQIHTSSHKEQAVFVCGACGIQTQHRHIMVKHLECHVISNLLAVGGDAEPAIKVEQPVEIDAALVQGTIEIQNLNSEVENSEVEVKGDIHSVEEAKNYKCNVCQALFVNLTEAVSDSHTCMNEEAQMVEGIELREGMEFSVLLQDSGVSISTGSDQQS